MVAENASALELYLPWDICQLVEEHVAAVREMTDRESRLRLPHRRKSGRGASPAVEDLPGGAGRWLGRRCRCPNRTNPLLTPHPVTMPRPSPACATVALAHSMST